METLKNSFIISCTDAKAWISNESGLCTQILVKNDFKGKYHDSIGIGSTLSDLNRLGLEWYEDLDVYMIKGVKGICFELSDEENGDEWDELTTPIACISVFVD